MTGEIVCGVDLVKITTNNGKVKPTNQPKMMVSEVDSHGIVIVTFNESMDVSSFFKNDTTDSRSLKRKSGGESSGF